MIRTLTSASRTHRSTHYRSSKRSRRSMRNVASNKLTHMYLRKIPLESHQTLDERLSVVSGRLVIYWSYGNSGSESLFGQSLRIEAYGGAEGDRTPDLRIANAALCQTELLPHAEKILQFQVSHKSALSLLSYQSLATSNRGAR